VPAVQAVVHFPYTRLLKADNAAAINTPFSHGRIASYRSTATLANRSHHTTTFTTKTGRVFIKLMENTYS